MASTMEEELMAALRGEPVDAGASDPSIDETVDDGGPANNADRARDEAGRFKAKEQTDKGNDGSDPALEAQADPAATAVVEKPKEQAPQGWTAEAKGVWEKLPADARKEILRREADVHKMFTAHDGDLNMGRRIKETVAPYMAMIQAEGATPEVAIRELLGNAYRIRTGTPLQKAEMVHQLCQQFGVDMSLVGQYQQVQHDPAYQVQALQQQIAQMQANNNPAGIEARVIERIENDRINAEVSAFAADPKNSHFETVKPLMAALLQNGSASGMQEAYDMACYANPQIRSTLQAASQQELEAKRKADIEMKRRAASSIAGSPASKAASTGKPNGRSIEDELAEQFAAYNETLN